MRGVQERGKRRGRRAGTRGDSVKIRAGDAQDRRELRIGPVTWQIQQTRSAIWRPRSTCSASGEAPCALTPVSANPARAIVAISRIRTSTTDPVTDSTSATASWLALQEEYEPELPIPSLIQLKAGSSGRT